MNGEKLKIINNFYLFFTDYVTICFNDWQNQLVKDIYIELLN
jgi:hypothetical protein